MIIDKTKPFWTNEEVERYNALKTNLLSAYNPLTAPLPLPKDIELPEDKIEASKLLTLEIDAIENKIDKLYLQYIENHPEQLDKDIVEILEAVEKQDFDQSRKERTLEVEAYKISIEERYSKGLINANPFEDPNSLYHRLFELTEDTPQNASGFLEVLLDLQITASAIFFEAGQVPNIDIYKEIKKKIEEWYPEQTTVAEPFFLDELTYKPTLPSKRKINLTKASRVIFDPTYNLEGTGEAEILISPKELKNKRDKKTGELINSEYYVIVNIPEAEGIEVLTGFDESVLNSIYTFIQYNNTNLFTAEQIARHLYYGDNPKNSNPSPQQVEEVTKSIEKLRNKDIVIDWTEHAKLNKMPIKEGEKYTITNKFLPSKIHTLTGKRGLNITGYEVTSIPPTFEYALAVKQISTINASLLNVPIKLDNEKLIIREYLLREIERIKSPKANKKENTITLQKIFSSAGLDISSITAKKKSTILSAIESMLLNWKQKDHITGYSINKKGREIYSITITAEKNSL